MRILYDHQIFTTQEYGGISRYYYELIKRFKRDEVNKAIIPPMLVNNTYINREHYRGTHSFFPKNSFKGKVRIMNMLNRRQSLMTLRTSNFSIFHPTYYDSYFLEKLRGKPFVVTCHDMIHEKFEGQFNELALDKKIYFNKRLLLKEAAKVIAISKTTRDDIIKVYGTEAEKIEVIYHGGALCKSNTNDQRIVSKPYLLYVGTRTIYKNFNFFLESIEDVIMKNSDLFIVCAGGGQLKEAELKLINRLDLTGRVLQYRVDDEILTNLYKYAEAFVFPSLYEGFGIPVLEAFSCNCPCVLSNGGSLPEIGGDGAIYFDPTDSNSIASAVTIVLNDKTLRERLVCNGNDRLSLFSWDKTYQETLKLYTKLL